MIYSQYTTLSPLQNDAYYCVIIDLVPCVLYRAIFYPDRGCHRCGKYEFNFPQLSHKVKFRFNMGSLMFCRYMNSQNSCRKPSIRVPESKYSYSISTCMIIYSFILGFQSHLHVQGHMVTFSNYWRWKTPTRTNVGIFAMYQ